MPDISSKNLLNCCINTAVEYGKSNPQPKDGDVIKCLHCSKGWMIYVQSKNQWEWFGLSTEELKPLNKDMIDKAQAHLKEIQSMSTG